jgi:16S rRNA (guanine527-N7)-methyltransferase
VTAEAARLGEMGERWSLAAGQLEALAALLEGLRADPFAPSAVRGAAAVDVHVADSLSALELECVRGARRVADLGSGAGFPGLVLAAALPGARVALVESAARKCAFLERLRARGGIANAYVVCARAEEWREGLGAQDLVAARALAPLAVLCEYAAPLLEIGGSLVAWKGATDSAEVRGGERAALVLGLQDEGAVRSAPYPGSVAHHLHVYRKVAPTPAGYPRRAGIARKRPLGGSP